MLTSSNNKYMQIGDKAPGFRLPTTTGGYVSLADYEVSKALVIVFMCNHCPYVVNIRSELIKFANDYHEKLVSVLAINSNDATMYPEDSFEKMEEYAKKYDYPFTYAFDKDQSVAKAYKAVCTPEIFVFDKNMFLKYHGQFDSSRPGSNVPPSGEDVRRAVEYILQGKELDFEQKPAIGCSIKWKD